MRKNIQTHPELARVNLGQAKLLWTKHASLRCIEKSITKTAELDINGNVVEMEFNLRTRKPSKIIVRVSHDSEYDMVIALVPCKQTAEGFLLVTTVWLNHKEDNHATLRTERISA